MEGRRTIWLGGRTESQDLCAMPFSFDHVATSSCTKNGRMSTCSPSEFAVPACRDLSKKWHPQIGRFPNQPCCPSRDSRFPEIRLHALYQASISASGNLNISVGPGEISLS
jgi:hypothetical protein